MEEQLQLIESKLHSSATVFPPLRDYLLKSGEIKAWFKYYNGPNQWQERFYMEEHLFLLESKIVVAYIYRSGKLSLRTLMLDEISRIERDYDFEEKGSQKLVLAQANIIFKRNQDKKRRDGLLIKRPLPAEQGDPEGFDKFMSLLD